MRSYWRIMHFPSTFLIALVISRVKGLSLSPSLEETLCHCSSRNREFILESLEQKRQASTMKSSEWIKQELDKDKDNIVQVKVCMFSTLAQIIVLRLQLKQIV
jgi:hypothetical protein